MKRSAAAIEQDQQRILDSTKKANMAESTYDWELAVIGGGSGGIACSKEAGLALGEGKVVLFDYVRPTPSGTKWGVGGTCVNVGCIPKKLMHTAARYGEIIKDSADYGWQGIDNEKLANDWETLRTNVGYHIKGINWGYRRTNLPDHNVKYINSYARFVDKHTLEVENAKGEKSTVTANKIVIAVGGRPRYPDIPGAQEFGISSDDIFWLEKAPGKTLVVGASYVALECAGFLRGLGFDTTVMVRSIFLRGFDQQCADMIGADMAERGVKFLRPATPDRLERNDEGRIVATYTMRAEDGSTSQHTEEFDTVVFAIGRDPEVSRINIDKVGVNVEANGKIAVNDEQTNVDNIYAIGDVVHGIPELTPVAIQQGKFLSRRLYHDQPQYKMDWNMIPTTVFTPLEYGAVGMSEDAAIEQYGEDNIEVWHTYFTPLEWTVPHRPENKCYAKLVCNRQDDDRVLGFHVLGDHAAEITQGYALGIKLGAKFRDFVDLVGIHPSSAEEFTTIKYTKRSGVSALQTGC